MTDPNETIAYVHGSDNPGNLGTLFDGGILVVDGAVHPIPAGDPSRGDPPAQDRIVAVLAEAGWRLPCHYVYAMGVPDLGGVFEVRVVPA